MPKASAKPQLQGGTYYIWRVEDRPISVHLNLDVVQQLEPLIRAGFEAIPRRGLEVGGLLLGRVRHPDTNYYIVSVDSFEPIESEHLRGPSFVLSAKDRSALEKRIERRSAAAGEELMVVGMFRSHTRPGLYLDEYDFDLIRTFFCHPSSIFLLVRPSSTEVPAAGIFFWENGDIRREAPYEEFPFRAANLKPAGFDVPSPRAAAEPIPSPNATSPSVIAPIWPRDEQAATGPVVPQEEVISTAAFPAAPERRGGFPQALPFPDTAPPPAADRNRAEERTHAAAAVAYGKRALERVRAICMGGVARARAMHVPRVPMWAGVAAVAAVIIICAALWRTTNRNSQGGLLTLRAEKSGDALQLRWDRKAPAIADASAATLQITDGGQSRDIELDKGQLQSGSIVYWPSTSDVNFRMEVRYPNRNVVESVRTVFDDPATTAGRQGEPLPSVNPPAGMNPRKDRPLPAQTSAAVAEPPRASELPPRVVTQETNDAPDEVAPNHPGKVNARIPAPSVASSAPAATAETSEKSSGSALRRAVSTVPGLGWIQRSRTREREAFVPARPVREVNPTLPASVGREIAGGTIEVRVSIDNEGRVRGANLLTRNVDQRVAAAALDAAMRWQFEPARKNQTAVASNMVVHFRVRNRGGG